MNKKLFTAIAALFSAAVLFSGCSKEADADPVAAPTAAPTAIATEAPTLTPTEAPPTVTPIPMPDYVINAEPSKAAAIPEEVDNLKPYSWIQYGDARNLSKYDFTGRTDLLNALNFSNHTTFPKSDKMPADFDPQALLEWGKYAGLHMDVLYNNGLTGKGTNVAIIDQPALTTHENFIGVDIEYADTVPKEMSQGGDGTYNSMHGPCVLSLLAGKDIGTAPDAKVYFVEAASWEQDDQIKADCIQYLIDLNETLPEDQRVSMISMSDMLDREGNANTQAFHDAINRANEAGIWVWVCDYPLKLNDGAFLPMSDKNDPANIHTEAYSNAAPWTSLGWENVLTVPAGSRTTAYTCNNEDDEYVYWASGGVSWSAPYLTGIAATAHSIAPDLTQEDIIALFLKTAFTANGLKIINPVGFMAEVLNTVGDYELGNKLLVEAGFVK